MKNKTFFQLSLGIVLLKKIYNCVQHMPHTNCKYYWGAFLCYVVINTYETVHFPNNFQKIQKPLTFLKFANWPRNNFNYVVLISW